MSIRLRALEISDIDRLYSVENDSSLWKYSNRTHPDSKATLMDYIAQAHQDIYQAGQLRLAIANAQDEAVGFVDLFDFEPLHRRAGIGLVVCQEERNKGYATTALQLLMTYSIEHLSMHQLYAGIAAENKESIRLFEVCGFEKTGYKKQWNFYEAAYHDEYFYQKIL